MWANAQCNGDHAEYRCRPLFNAAKYGWRPVLECRAVMLPRRETRWNVLGCPKLANRSQPLKGRSSPYCEDMWGRLPFNKFFFRLSIRNNAGTPSGGRQLSDQANQLGLYVCWQAATIHIQYHHMLLLLLWLSPRADTHFTVPCKWKFQST